MVTLSETYDVHSSHITAEWHALKYAFTFLKDQREELGVGGGLEKTVAVTCLC